MCVDDGVCVMCVDDGVCVWCWTTTGKAAGSTPLFLPDEGVKVQTRETEYNCQWLA